MFVNFGHGKCPVCGDFGNRMQKQKGSFSCRRCMLAFDKFSVVFFEEPQDNGRFWN